jgi:molecular chaperone DnaJ
MSDSAMSDSVTPTHYQLLEVSTTATTAEIKQSFRRLAKVFHPDRHTNSTQQAQFLKKFQTLSAAYEVLSDTHQRQQYDQILRYGPTYNSPQSSETRDDRTEAARQRYKARQKQDSQESEDQVENWINRIYTPVVRLMGEVLKPLRSQIKALSADPFDDELMEEFQLYIEDCRTKLDKAQVIAGSLPNPPIAATVSANLYYCMHQLADALNELEYFTQNYDETYLHDGVEMFRIAADLRKEAMNAARHLKP